MLEFGSRISLPATYRMSLALSVALLVHTLIGAAIVVLLASDVEQPPTTHLNLTLVSRGHQPQQPSASSNPIESAQVSTTDTVAASPAPRPVTTRSPQSSPKPRPAPPKPEPAPTAKQQQAPAPEPAAVESQNHKVGKASPLDGENEAPVSQLAPSRQVQPPTFVEELRMRISREMGRSPVKLPKPSLRSALKPIELELRLMENGTLIRADVIKTSGVQKFDQSAIRAALRASPYPKPPQDGRGDGLRYRVKLYFAPAPP